MKNRLREVRKKQGLTLKELSQQVGLANNTLSQYETGKREPKLETWKKLADYFQVSVPYLQGFDLMDRSYSGAVQAHEIGMEIMNMLEKYGMDSKECEMLISDIKIAFDNYNGTYVSFE